MDSSGFFLCDHCHRVVELSAREIEAAENGPEGRLVDLPCPQCRHRAVNWVFADGHQNQGQRVKPAPVPVDRERAKMLFKQIKERIGCL